MRIGVNLLYLIPGQCGGTETYGVCLVNALAQLDPANEYIVYLNKESASLPLTDAPNLKKVVCNLKATHRPLRYLYEQLVLPFLVIKHRIDLLHSMGYVAPLLAPCLNVVSVHDTNFLDVGETFSRSRRMMLGFFSSASVRRADHVITISAFSKQAICRHLGTAETKITVTLLGPGWASEQGIPVDWGALRSHYELPERYIIAIGGGALHKNIPRLIEAYLGCAEVHETPLVLMGRLPGNVQLPKLQDGTSRARIQCLGYVPQEHIHPLLSHSALYVHPSLYEGFGMPILEAQAAGVLVASSSAASLPEVGGEGAIYFDPTSVPAIAEALRAGLKGDASRIAGILAAAESNLQKFSWNSTAQASLDIYRCLLPRAS